MRVIIDGLAYSHPIGGTVQYFDELLSNFSKFSSLSVDVIKPRSAVKEIFAYPNVRLRKSRNFSIEKIPFRTIQKGFDAVQRRLSALWWAHEIRRDKEVIFHSTTYSRFSIRSIPHIVTAHDMIPEKFPQFFQGAYAEKLKTNKISCLKNATRIIAISENTKRDLVSLMNVNPNLIEIVHHGINREVFSPPTPIEKTRFLSTHSIHKPYILYVGGRWGYRNFRKLLEAYHDGKFSKDYLLLVAGPPWSDDERSWLKNNIAQSSVKLIEYPSTNELRLLYGSASVFVYPSLYEGFGLPPLEAMACSTPVATSRGGAIPEVVGDAGFYFDPLDPNSIVGAIDYLLQPKNAALFRERGSKRVELFSWEETALKTLNVYRSAVTKETIT